MANTDDKGLQLRIYVIRSGEYECCSYGGDDEGGGEGEYVFTTIWLDAGEVYAVTGIEGGCVEFGEQGFAEMGSVYIELTPLGTPFGWVSDED